MNYEELVKALLSASTVSTAWGNLMQDAAAAIEALQAEIRESMQKCAECGAEPITLEQAIDRLHELGWLQEHDRILSQPHWISAELPPKKPENGVRAEFLVCLESGCVRTLLYEFGYSVPDGYAPLFDEGWHSTWSPVKYWMPLPEPPQEVQE